MTTTTTTYDLATINALQRIAQQTIEAEVMKMEQWAADAQGKGMDAYAKQLQHAARELDFALSKLSSAFTSVFLEELDRQMGKPVITRQSDVVLPDLPSRPYAKSKVVETTATTVE